jgi:hypothetical protein
MASFPHPLFVVKCKQPFQAFCVILETATDVNALQYFVIALVRSAQIVRHGVGVIEIGDGGGEMVLARE